MRSKHSKIYVPLKNFFSNILASIKHRRITAAILVMAVISSTLMSATIFVAQSAGTTYTVRLGSNLSGNKVTAFVNGIGAVKNSDGTYTVKANTPVSIMAINESVLFTRWTASGVAVTNAHLARANFVMPENDVTLNVETEPTTGEMGKSFSTAFPLNDFYDAFYLQEIVANRTVPSGKDALFATYIDNFGFSGDYATARDAIIHGYYKVVTPFALNQPIPAGYDETVNGPFVPDAYFKGIGTRDNSFLGCIDGNGKNLTMNATIVNNQYTGLFAYLSTDFESDKTTPVTTPVVLRNITTLGGVSVRATSAYSGDKSFYYGGIAAYMEGQIAFYNNTCKASGFVDLSDASGTKIYYGGLIGYNKSNIAHGSNNKYVPGAINASATAQIEVHLGGGIGYSENAYILGLNSDFVNTKLIGRTTLSTATTTVNAGGAVGTFVNNIASSTVALKNCKVVSPAYMQVSAQGMGTTQGFAAAGGVAGVIKTIDATTKVAIAENIFDTDSDNDGVTSATVRALDSGSATDATICYAGGLYGRIDQYGQTAGDGVYLDGNFGSILNAKGKKQASDAFNGTVYVEGLSYGKGYGNGAVGNGLGATACVGQVIGQGSFTFTGPLTIDTTFVRIAATQKATTTAAGTLFAGVFVGGFSGRLGVGPETVAAPYNLIGLTLIGENIEIAARREAGSTNSAIMYVGGLVGQKTAGVIEDCNVYFGSGEMFITQDSYSSKTGYTAIGGIVGSYFMQVSKYTAGSIKNCTFAPPAPTEQNPNPGQGIMIENRTATYSASHGTSDPWLGGIAGEVKGYTASNYTSVYKCKYVGNKDSTDDCLKLYSNQGANSPAIGGLIGYAWNNVVVKECQVIDADIYGDAYTAGSATDQDIIVGGAIGLTSNSTFLLNMDVTGSKIVANGRENTLAYVGGLVGSNFGNPSTIKGCIVENNVLNAVSQKRWASCGGIQGYLYDGSQIIVEHCISLDNILTVTSAAHIKKTDGIFDAGINSASAGGIFGKANTAYATNFTVSYSFVKNQFFVTQPYDGFDDSGNRTYEPDTIKIFTGGIVGWKNSTTNQVVTNCYYDANTLGTTTAIGGQDSPTQDSSSTLYDTDFYLTDANSMILFPTVNPYGPTTALAGKTGSVTTGSRPGDSAATTYFVTPESSPYTITANPSTGKYQAVAKDFASKQGESESVLWCKIWRNDVSGANYNGAHNPGSATVVERPFLTINGHVGEITTPAKVDVYQDALPGDDNSKIIDDTNCEFTYKLSTSESSSYDFYGLTDIDENVKWEFYDSNHNLVQPSALSVTGADIHIDHNKISIYPNVEIDTRMSFYFRAVSVADANIKSPDVKINIEPLYVQEIRLVSFTASDTVNNSIGSLNDAIPIGSTPSKPIVIIQGQNINLSCTVYGEGSTDIGTENEVYVKPSIDTSLFSSVEPDNALAVSYPAALSVYADGTIFCNTANTKAVDGAVFKVKAYSIGKKSDGNQAVLENYVYIRINFPNVVTPVLSGSITRTYFNPALSANLSVVGATFSGSLTHLVNIGVDYSFTAAPQIGYGGEVEAYYCFGTANGTAGQPKYVKIPIYSAENPFDKNSVPAYGELTGSASKYNYKITIRGDAGNTAKQNNLNIILKYNTTIQCIFDPNNGREATVVQVPIGTAIGNAYPTPAAYQGYSFYGWYLLDDAMNESGYGAPLNRDTTINGSIIYYARWHYKTSASVTPAFTYQETYHLDNKEHFSFKVTKNENYIGKPVYYISVGGQLNPAPIPDDYDTPQTITIPNPDSVRGQPTAVLEITRNAENETVYNFTYYAEYINKYIDAENNNNDGIKVLFGYLDMEFINEENVENTKNAILQDTTFTVRYIANHWKNIAKPTESTHAYLDAYRDVQKDVKLSFKKNGVTQNLPKGTVVRLHYRRFNDATSDMDRSVWKYILTDDASEFTTDIFTHIGNSSVKFLDETYAQFTSSSNMMPEEYFFVITVPYQSAALSSSLDAYAEFTGIPDSRLDKGTIVSAKREIDLTITNDEITIDKTTGGQFTFDTTFTNILTNYQTSDNRENHFGISIWFENENGETVFLPSDSVIYAANPATTLTTRAIKPLEKYHFVAGSTKFTVDISDKIKDPIRMGNRQKLLKDAGAYKMIVALTVSNSDYMYGNSDILKKIVVPMVVA